MQEKSINLQKTESLLVELIPEALSSLNDSRIKSLPITDVNCKTGKYNAVVYFDATDLDKDELKEVHKLLKKANGRIKSHCLASTGWYKCPDFNFVSDNSIEKSKRLEDLFEQIKTK
ncbi:MAG: 30S ribosome-binding factor RbfA [Campylobacteraceae bacterium]|jgi:ribosome-binding factor A|nr:30S ribosome-binding factor RbfA [Campylobacteraceae bacterium]MBT3882517.1 30S ribosome-binding factor RbfA [Campylobacteraceae bacterium]MBT4031169.1 30S ribosome-binding factor RbfA [Campylobacteraceae bacterium]MBT4179799.1 30S ribosome-binding factor RbfA [Campylobacteraceae bacterium]MBT4572165.1 30S ribosome-binding factor RbfA [Campylobacteraceae bacterium]